MRERASAAAGKRWGPDLVKSLRGKDSWEDVLSDDALVRKGSAYQATVPCVIHLRTYRQ